MGNFALARLFYEMASLLEARESSVFRVRAYQRAAQTLETLGEDVAAVAARGELTALPGIGRDLAARIGEYLATGRIAQLEELRATLPAAFLTFLEIRGLGPAHRPRAGRSGRGVGGAARGDVPLAARSSAWPASATRPPTTSSRASSAGRPATRARSCPPRAAVAAQIAEALRAHGGVERLEIAGSLRRMRETVKDIDLLVTSTEPARVIETLTTLPSVTEVIVRGPTKASVRHQDGLQIDLRVVEPAAFGAALQYFTGSKDHNVRVREIASRRGLRISEYGVFDERTGERVAGATEEEVYATVGLPWIPPELRENQGEIEAAREGRLPTLVTAGDIRGDLHAHTDWSDGRHSLEALVTAAQARGYEYIIVSDHSRSTTIAGGLGVEELRAQRAAIRELQPRFRIRILAGSECDILADGTLDFPDDVLGRARRRAGRRALALQAVARGDDRAHRPRARPPPRERAGASHRTPPQHARALRRRSRGGVRGRPDPRQGGRDQLPRPSGWI